MVSLHVADSFSLLGIVVGVALLTIAILGTFIPDRQSRRWHVKRPPRIKPAAAGH